MLPWEPCTPTALRQGRALNGRGRACAARKAAMHGAGPFASSPALLQSAALGGAGRGHLNPGLARSSRRPGLTPAARWAARPTRSVLARLPSRLRVVGWKTYPTAEKPSGRGVEVALTLLSPQSARGHPLPQNLEKFVKFLPQQAARKRDAARDGSGGGFNSHWGDHRRGLGLVS